MTELTPTPKAHRGHKRFAWWRPGVRGWVVIAVLACLTTWVTAWGPALVDSFGPNWLRELLAPYYKLGMGSSRYIQFENNSAITGSVVSTFEKSEASLVNREGLSSKVGFSVSAWRDAGIPGWAFLPGQVGTIETISPTDVLIANTFAFGWPARCVRTASHQEVRPDPNGHIRWVSYGYLSSDQGSRLSSLPANIYFPGLALDLGFWSGVFYVVVGLLRGPSERLWKRLRALRSGRDRCRACGYSLSGLRDDPGGRICPECGERERVPAPAAQA